MNDIGRDWDAAAARARDPRAEQAVLGGCFMRPAILDWLDLDREAFWDPRHAHVWDAMQAIARRAEQVDELTVAAELDRAGRLAMVGGVAYLGQLALNVPTVENVSAYAEVLREHLVSRRLLRLASALPRRILDGEIGEDLLSEVQGDLSRIDVRRDEGIDLADAIRAQVQVVVDETERKRRGEQVAAIPTGVAVFDQRVGGIPVGVPTVLGARPKVGKSSFALCLVAQAWRLAGVRSEVVTLEDKSPIWSERALAQAAELDVSRIAARTLDRGELAQLVSGAERSADLRGGVHLFHGHGLDMTRLARFFRASKRQRGTRLFVLDYLQLVTPGPHERRLQREERLELAMNAVADLAGSEDVAFLVLSQLNRRGEEDGRRPMLSDFRGTGAIEQVAKLVLALHPGQLESEIELLVLANHQGPPAKLIARRDASRCWIG